MSEVCKNVAIDPRLLPVIGEEFELRSTNIEDDSRLDVKAIGFYWRGQVAYFDIIVTHLNGESNKSQPTEKVFLKHENEKKRAYNQALFNCHVLN